MSKNLFFIVYIIPLIKKIGVSYSLLHTHCLKNFRKSLFNFQSLNCLKFLKIGWNKDWWKLKWSIIETLMELLLRVCLTVIIKNVYSIFNTWNFFIFQVLKMLKALSEITIKQILMSYFWFQLKLLIWSSCNSFIMLPIIENHLHPLEKSFYIIPRAHLHLNLHNPFTSLV